MNCKRCIHVFMHKYICNNNKEAMNLRVNRGGKGRATGVEGKKEKGNVVIIF